MKIILFLALTLFTAAVSAQQHKSDTVHRHKYNEPPDTTGMGQYGMRMYNPRTFKYIPAPPDTTFTANPYTFADKKINIKKPVSGRQ